MEQITLHHPSNHTKYRCLTQEEVAEIEPLLVDILREGKLVYDLPTIEEMRQRRQADVTSSRPWRPAPHESPRLPRLTDQKSVGSQAGTDPVSDGQEPLSGHHTLREIAPSCTPPWSRR